MIKLCTVDPRCYYGDSYFRRYEDVLIDVGAQCDFLGLADQSLTPADQMQRTRIFTIPISRNFRNQWGHFLEYGIDFILFTIRLLILHIKNRYQIIHVHNMPDFLIFTALIPRLLGAKLILDIRDPMPEFYMSKNKGRTVRLVVWLMEWQEKLSTLLAHSVITTNTFFRDNLVERGIPSEKITVINYMPDPKIFNRSRYETERRRHDRDKYFTLIYPGTIAQRYGLDIAIHALPSLVTRIPNIRLVIIGPHCKYVDKLVTLAQRLGVSSSVKFVPQIPARELPQEMIQADLGIYPAIPDPHMEIAFPMKVLEYAVMGIPIIASRLRVLEELFPDSSIMFFDPGKVDQFVGCVLELYNNPMRRDDLARMAYKISSRAYSCDAGKQKYIKLLNRLIAPEKDVITSADREESSL